MANTVPLSGVTAEGYDAVFFPGGHGPLWDLVEDPVTPDPQLCRSVDQSLLAQRLGFRVQDLGFRVYGTGSRVQGLGLRCLSST